MSSRRFIYFLTFIIFVGIFSLAQLKPAVNPWWHFGSYSLFSIFLVILLFNLQRTPIRIFSNSYFILLTSFFLRLFFFEYPASDDVNRYAWEGKRLFTEYNPYIHRPDTFYDFQILQLTKEEKKKLARTFSAYSIDKKILANALNEECAKGRIPFAPMMKGFKTSSRWELSDEHKKEQLVIFVRNHIETWRDHSFAGINHKNMPTIYPPLSLMFSFVLMKISDEMISFRVAFIFVDILIIFFLMRLCHNLKRESVFVLLYAWCPLVLVYGVGECHFDVLHLLWIVIALNFLPPSKLSRYYEWCYLFIGLAVMTKFISIILLPFFIRKSHFLSLFLFLFLLPICLYIPFWDPHMFDSLLYFSKEMNYNDSFARLIRLLVVDRNLASSLQVVLFGLGLIVLVFLFQDRVLRGVQLAWAWLLFCLPVLHPWYLLPLAAFQIFFFSQMWQVAFIAIGLTSYTLYHQALTQTWVEFWWLPSILYGSMLFIFLLTKNKYVFEVKNSEIIQSMDIVVPVFQEELRLHSFLQNVVAEIELLKIQMPNMKVSLLLVDGGSTDNTLDIIKKAEIPYVISTEKGRGNQLACGFENTSGDLVLFLHSDSLLCKGALRKCIDSFKHRPSLCWGVLGHQYDVRSFKLKIIEMLNNVRMNWCGVGFGDQGMFFRREVLNEVGVPKIPLMEDMELSLRMAHFPQRIHLENGIIGSARRWQKKKFASSVYLVFILCMEYLFLRKLGVSIDKLATRMYKQYYQ